MIGLILSSFARRILDALKWCAERPAIALAVASLVAAAFFYLRADHFREKYENLRDEYALHKAADEESRRFAEAEKKRIDTERKKATDEADTKLRIALADADERLRNYARRHPASVSGAATVAEVADGRDPEAIVVTFGDAERCTVAVARLENAQKWAFDIYEVK